MDVTYVGGSGMPQGPEDMLEGVNEKGVASQGTGQRGDKTIVEHE